MRMHVLAGLVAAVVLRIAFSESAKPERRGRPAGSRAHFLKLNATG